jgi:predicted MFS family arabinose efflux permease
MQKKEFSTFSPLPMTTQSARAATTTAPTSWLAIGVLYLTAVLQGLAMVSFPASSAVLTGPLGLSDAQYGAIFLPQVALAIVGSIGGGTLAQRWGLKPLLLMTLLANALSQVLLGGAIWVDSAWAFPAVLVGTASMGFAFGVGGAPLNSYPPLFFPETSDTAVVALHSLLGSGLALGPILVAPFIARDAWIGFPILLAALCGLTLLAAIGLPFPRDDDGGETADAPRPVRSGLFWAFVVAAVAYAFAEGTFSNWAVMYLHEARGVPEATAGLALSVFWAALVGGRLLTSALVLRISSQAILVALPVLMGATFLLLPLAEGAALGIGLFALAGLGCSSFFPLIVTLIGKAYPEHVAWASSMMIASLMLGVGAGSFIFGPLRSTFSFETIYQVSALYPAVALLAAFVIVRSEPCKQSLHELWTGSRCQ